MAFLVRLSVEAVDLAAVLEGAITKGARLVDMRLVPDTTLPLPEAAPLDPLPEGRIRRSPGTTGPALLGVIQRGVELGATFRLGAFLSVARMSKGSVYTAAAQLVKSGDLEKLDGMGVYRRLR